MGSSEYDEEDMDDFAVSDTESIQNSPVKPSAKEQEPTTTGTVEQNDSCKSKQCISTVSPSKDVLGSLIQQMEGRVIAHIDMVGNLRNSGTVKENEP
jgi:hypothetical protein